jgi:hypothetical protein
MEHSVFHLGHGVLAHTATDAMYYFKMSPFYSTSCNNEDPRIPVNELGRNFLRDMTGVEYDVDDEASTPPSLWVINQQMRTAPNAAAKLNVFYVVNEVILQAPRASQLIEARLSNVNHHLRVALETLAAFKPVVGEGDGAISSTDLDAAGPTEAGILVDPATAESLRALRLGQGQGWGADAMRQISGIAAQKIAEVSEGR